MDREPQAANGHEPTIVIEGITYRYVRYGEERINGVDAYATPCPHCSAEPGAAHGEGCPLGPGWLRRPETCRDCGVGIGDIHVAGCGFERCPHCGGQLASCDCESSEDDEDSDADPMGPLEPQPCRRCGQTGLPVAWGYPDESLMQAAARGEVLLGGCIIPEVIHTHECPAGHQWNALLDERQ